MPALLVNGVHCWTRYRTRSSSVIDISSILVEVGARLREQRELLGMSQADFGAMADVTRGSQAEYELGKRPFSASYIIAVQARGVDMNYVLTGKRSIENLSEEQARLLHALNTMPPEDRETVLRVALSFTNRAPPEAKLALPSTAALEEALGVFLDQSANLTGDELVRELAMSMPTILHGAADAVVAFRSGRVDTPPSPLKELGDDRRAVQPKQRT